jgi:4-hydroxy-tetrahydrodipicolinate synthase
MKFNLKGSATAMVTPFLEDQSIDFEALKKHTEFLIQNGVDYLVVMGTTGESVTLNRDEKQRVLETVIEQNRNRLPIVMGVGGYDTQDICDSIRQLANYPVAAILSVTPYYNKPTQAGLIAHYKTIAHNTDFPIILYNVPGRTGVNMEAETTLTLAETEPRIVAVKEASGQMTQMMKIIKHKPKHFQVISGDDAITLPLMAVGADGAISVISNAFPKEFSMMVHAAQNGDFPTALNLHLYLLDFIEACFKENSPAGIKALMSLKRQLQNVLRLPLIPVSKTLEQQLFALLDGKMNR